MTRKAAIRHFRARVYRLGPLFRGTRCWFWRGEAPLAWFRDRYLDPRRVAFMIRMPIPAGRILAPRCPSGTCINPRHMALVPRPQKGPKSGGTSVGHASANPLASVEKTRIGRPEMDKSKFLWWLKV